MQETELNDVNLPARLDQDQSRELGLELNIEEVIAGEKRLAVEEAMRLYAEASLHDLGRWSSSMATRIHGHEKRTYIIDRNVNYTNVCSANCTFCAFKRNLGHEESYTLTREQLHQKTQELVDIGGTQLLLQGGMHPELPLSFYEDMLADLKQHFPHIHLHAFSPPEFVEFVAVCEVDGFPTPGIGKGEELSSKIWLEKLRVIMTRLKKAGLDSIPGGGGEIFAEHVRKRIGLGKATADEWLDVMRVAHQLGMHTSATMMFGHVEGVRDRMDHMLRVRDAQQEAIDKNWPGKYLAFIAWPFQRENTPLGRLPEYDPERDGPFAGDELAEGRTHPKAGKLVRMAGASEYLRMQAISRLFLDNIHSIGSSWVTMGPRIGQMALFYGANDMGSVMMEENVVSAAGTTYCLSEAMICRLIRDSGYTPAQRNNTYDILKEYPSGSSDAPDLKVEDWSDQNNTKAAPESFKSELPITSSKGDTSRDLDVALPVLGD